MRWGHKGGVSTETWPDRLARDGNTPSVAAGLAPRPVEDRRKLPGDRQFERGAGLGVLNNTGGGRMASSAVGLDPAGSRPIPMLTDVMEGQAPAR